MAESMGLKNASTYMKYEKGEYSFRAEHLPILAKTLNCEIQDLFEE
jgi:transcriptional regulator with XRE-family HTH domain